MIGVDNRTGRHPSLVARDIRRIHEMRAAGATAPQIASAVNVSVRTVWRYLGAYLVHETIAGHPMTFLIYPGRRPVVIDGDLRR